MDAHNGRNLGGSVPYIALFGSFPDLTPLAPFYSHVAAYDGQGNRRRFASRSVLARYIGPARDCGIGTIRVMVRRDTRVVRTWRYLAATSATIGDNTMRVEAPAPESPPVEGTRGPLSTGGSMPPPALLPPPALPPIAQHAQVHNTAETYIGALEKEGRMISEATASHLYSVPWTILPTYRPTGYQWPTLPPHLVDTTPPPPPPPGFTPRPSRKKQPAVRFDPDVTASAWQTPTATVAAAQPLLLRRRISIPVRAGSARRT